MTARIGVDVGGTKIEALLLDKDGTERLRKRVSTPAGDYDKTVETIGHLVEHLEAEAGEPATVGVGAPGAPSPTSGRQKNANSVVLNGRRFLRDLEQRLRRPVRLANDADCLAVSEATDGAAAGAGIVFAAILGTGVGGGIVVNGRPVRGPNAIAGEWGHNPLPGAVGDEVPGPLCYCGRRGCIETWLSGPALSADHLRATGQQQSAHEVAAAAQAGDAKARASMDRYCERLARALASIINVLDPHVIVLGGGLSRIEALYTAVPGLWGAHVFGGDEVATRLVPAMHGDSSGVRGAAWLWPPNHSEDVAAEPVGG